MNAQKMPRLCGLKIQAITPYSLAWSHQRSLVEARIANPDLPDVLLPAGTSPRLHPRYWFRY